MIDSTDTFMNINYSDEKEFIKLYDYLIDLYTWTKNELV